MLGHKRVPSREGGVEVVVGELAQRMAALGNDVTVYNRAGHNVAGKEYGESCEAGDSFDWHGVHVKTVPTLNIKGLAAASSSYYAVKAAISDHPDVIHFHAEGPCAVLGMAKRAGIRTVATVHGLDWQRAKWGHAASAYLKHGEKVAVRDADEIIVLSRNVQEYFNREYGRKTRFIPNGVTLSAPHAPHFINEQFGLGCENYLLYVGRMVPEKGVHYLLDAYRQIKTDMPLVLVGGSSDSEDYFERVKEMAAKDSQVKLLGFRQGEELQELYSNAYAYILPSDLEGMPMSLLEAMSYGRCCLTSDIAECVEVLGDSGRTFKHGNVDSLARLLSDIISQPDEALRLGERARSRVKDKYDWDAVVASTLAVYEGR